MIVHASDIKSFGRCPQAWHLERLGYPRKQLSATAYGSVMHQAIHVLERTGDLDKAIDTFKHYWSPANIEAICAPVDIWIRRDTYGSLASRGAETLRRFHDLLQYDDSELLALEYEFVVPMHGTVDRRTGQPHLLGGTLDRLALRRYKGQLTVCVDDYKGLALDTQIPTPNGWTTMGALRVGDEVFGADGRPYPVTGKSQMHVRPCYRVGFDDGTSVVCDNVHLWEVHTGRHGEVVEVLSTEQLHMRNLLNPPRQRDQRIPNAEALQLPHVELPIHPYVLGAWLGDGRRKNGEICKPDVELFDNIEACGYRVAPQNAYNSRTVYGLTTQLRAANILGHKHIPDAYLRASFQQRLALLQGLMDTDGCWNRPRKQAVFSSTDKGLAEGVRELVVSLGWKARLWPLRGHGFGKDVDYFGVTFTPVDVNPFRLSRKADLVRMNAPARSRRRLITSITPTLTVPTQCIEVDSPDSLYLCTEAMVPTHNSGVQPAYLRHDVQGSAYAYATTQRGFWMGNPEYHTDGFDAERGAELFARTQGAARKFWWINLNTFKWVDAGFRGPRDYERLRLAVQAVADSVQAEIFPLNLSGEVCQWCSFRDVCGGVGLDDDEGAIA